MKRYPILPGHVARSPKVLAAAYTQRRGQRITETAWLAYPEAARAKRLQAWYDRRTAYWRGVVNQIMGKSDARPLTKSMHA